MFRVFVELHPQSCWNESSFLSLCYFQSEFQKAAVLVFESRFACQLVFVVSEFQRAADCMSYFIEKGMKIAKMKNFDLHSVVCALSRRNSTKTAFESIQSIQSISCNASHCSNSFLWTLYVKFRPFYPYRVWEPWRIHPLVFIRIWAESCRRAIPSS